MLKVLAACAALLATTAQARAEALPPVEVFGPKVCLACIDWADHLREHGFQASFTGVDDMARVKRRLKVPAEVESVHTAVVGGYFVEGHVPAGDIKQLLKEKPAARGLAVPGLPRGAPGRDKLSPFCESGCIVVENPDNISRRELFNTLLVGKDGKTSVWARH